jgi:hypothetical protein
MLSCGYYISGCVFACGWNISKKVNGNNHQSHNTLKAVTQFRINQELKYLYVKKQKLNEQLYHLHLICANNWQRNWPYIQANIDEKLQHYNERQYNNLNNKLDVLKNKKRPYNKSFNTNAKQEKIK